MWLVLAGTVLALMKYFDVGPVAAWSWWWIWSPFGLAALWWAWADSTGWTAKQQMNMLDKRREDRRRKNFEALGIDHRLVEKAGTGAGYREARQLQAQEGERERDEQRRKNEETLARSSTQFGTSELEASAHDPGAPGRNTRS